MPTDAQELPSPDLNSSKEAKAVDIQSPEQTRENLYAGVLYREATSLLGKYLPEALPQSPTEVFFSTNPGYIGKFKGRHYIATGSDATDQVRYKRNDKELRLMKIEQDREIRKIEERIKKEIAEEFGFTYEPETNEGEVEKDELEAEGLDNWEELVGSLEIRQGYSRNTWKAVNTLIHELMHQRQAELNPTAWPTELSSLALDQVDPDNIRRDDLQRLLREAWIPINKTMSEEQRNSIFYPVIEGMAVLGSYYVMGKFVKDLIEEGDVDTATKVRQARDRSIESFFRMRRNAEFVRMRPTIPKYTEGLEMMRKLYKRFGIENTPKILVSVDLNACRGIAKGSPEYQRMVEDPSLLPGLNKNPLVGSSIK